MNEDSRFPISGKVPLKYEVNGVEFLLKPPVGKTETAVQAIQTSVMNPKPYLEEAIKTVDASHKGKSWKLGERIQAITEEATRLAEEHFWDNFTTELNNEKRDQTFDIICIGWEGEGYKLEDGDKPSDHVVGAIKEKIVTWYLDNMNLSGEDRKNLLPPPDADFPQSQKLPLTVRSAIGKKKKSADA